MITNIEVTKLLQHPDNPRKNIGDVTELAESIKARGILQNLTVVPAENGMYTVVIGHRRLAAAKQAGLTEVPCAVVDMDYKTQLSTMLLENMQRSDLTVYEQAQGMQMMFDLGVPVAEIVEKTGFAEYLSACPEGLEAELAPGGGSMSGGQSQRLVLTRELLRGGDIILMDEPTSALDVRVSAKIQATMNEVFAGKPKTLITHDLSLARQYDRILVMSGGCLVGDGTHDSLLQSCEAYRKMNEIAGEEAEA